MDFGWLKNLIYAFLIFCGTAYYINTHYTFEDVLKYSQTHPSKDYSPMIVYYTGMSQFMQDKHDGAITSFQQLLADYPTCQYAPIAMVRLGSSLMERNRYAEAREIFEKYFEEFPNDKHKKTVEDKYEYIKFK
ncbi:MAG: tetratricopeptide repeat protein [Elusimicrobia bacterium]|nr:tetratricopeptide repeat protein [Elusimicrobiota bacterium]